MRQSSWEPERRIQACKSQLYRLKQEKLLILEQLSLVDRRLTSGRHPERKAKRLLRQAKLSAQLRLVIEERQHHKGLLLWAEELYVIGLARRQPIKIPKY